MNHNDEILVDTSAVLGFIIDDEGRLNNFAVEPEFCSSEHPSLQQQRYIYGGTAVVMLVAALVLLSMLESRR